MGYLGYLGRELRAGKLHHATNKFFYLRHSSRSLLRLPLLLRLNQDELIWVISELCRGLRAEKLNLATDGSFYLAHSSYALLLLFRLNQDELRLSRGWGQGNTSSFIFAMFHTHCSVCLRLSQ